MTTTDKLADALRKIAEFPNARADELSPAGMRQLARDTLAAYEREKANQPRCFNCGEVGNHGGLTCPKPM